MKLTALALAAAVATTTTLAKDCTKAQLDAAVERPEITRAQSACAGIKVEFTAASDADVKSLCSQKDCFSALEAAIELYPDCEYRGANIEAAFEMTYKTVLDGCQKAGHPIDASSASSSISRSPTAATVIFAAIAAVVVAVELIL